MAMRAVNRRDAIRGAVSLASCWAGNAILTSPILAESEQPVQVKVDEDHLLGPISADFMGLGYEVSSVAIPGLLSGSNHVYVQLIRTLSRDGVIRVGGATSDYAHYSTEGKLVSSPKSTVINKQCLKDLGSFLDATGWRLIWGLNLGQGSQSEAVEEARAVSAAVGMKLLAFEIGNEVDIFGGRHRQKGYSFDDYLGEYRSYKSAIRDALPDAPFAGPDAAIRNEWVSQFAAAEGRDLRLLTEHYYRAGQNASSSLEMLFRPDPKLVPMLQTLQSTSSSSKLPFRICETNSFSGGGKPGVSDTFGAALWVLDYMWTLASFDASGVNMETGVNHLGFISSYSPIGESQGGTVSATPEYYGMLAFSRASGGQRALVRTVAGELNLSAYAAVEGHKIQVTVINKERTTSCKVSLTCNARIAKASAMRLSGPRLESKVGVTFGGSQVSADGRWRPHEEERLTISSQRAELIVPSGSAAVVTLRL